MTQPLAYRRALRFIAGAFVAGTMVACSRGDRKQTDSGGTVSAALAAQRKAPPGALAKSIDQYTGDELFALTRRMQFAGGNERERRCRGRAECRGANHKASTRLRVDAVDQQDSLSARAVPANGVIALRAQNRGQIADTMYNMRPTARYEYYLIVLPGVNGTNATWRLEELDVARGVRAHRSVATGTFRECNHPFVRGARADFKSCATAAPVRPASSSAFMQTAPENPIWVGCATGCCTADPPDGRG